MTPRVLQPEEAFAPFVPPITLELTSLCNLKCPYCANPTLQRAYGEMPTEMIYRLADECAQEGHEIQYVHGVGEPLLRKDLETILARFTERGIWKGLLCTNGTLLTLPRMEALVKAGLKNLYLSLDTPDAALYACTRVLVRKSRPTADAGANISPYFIRPRAQLDRGRIPSSFPSRDSRAAGRA
jgi:MoaA/NifB/PqqE/SkfB family radical SAM enzyme